tara:strand:- start:9646 stop:10500 length:855 start_codon:yes stop_codon:yes gene_type:complete
LLEFETVTHIFPDGTKALNNVSLIVPKGQFCVFLGPSGAGKSTILSTVNGLVMPSEGKITLDGTPIDLESFKEVRSRIGMIHQHLHLVQRLSVLHNVLAGLLPTTPTWKVLLKLFSIAQQRTACRLIAEVELEEQQIYRRASELSGGQQQRVAIARAFINEPDVVVADEPVASIDPTVSRHVLGLLRNASRQRKTTVLCSLHQVEFAQEFADRIIGLNQGKVVFDGPPVDLTSEHLQKIYRGKNKDSFKSPDNSKNHTNDNIVGPDENRKSIQLTQFDGLRPAS